MKVFKVSSGFKTKMTKLKNSHCLNFFMHISMISVGAKILFRLSFFTRNSRMLCAS